MERFTQANNAPDSASPSSSHTPEISSQEVVAEFKKRGVTLFVAGELLREGELEKKPVIGLRTGDKPGFVPDYLMNALSNQNESIIEFLKEQSSLDNSSIDTK